VCSLERRPNPTLATTPLYWMLLTFPSSPKFTTICPKRFFQ
jgi:hypothetical protein